jgi:NAD(P)-dependent dehydrogenase (short-subunit alcohol dehydrogenase family)
MQVDLNGKVALVTGAAQGIGRAIADTMAENGAIVLYTDVNEEVLREAASASPGAGHAVLMDVTDEAQVDATIEEAARRYGSLDILVNNAGVNTLAHRVTIDSFPRREWDRLLEVDLTGVYLVGRAGSRVMRAAGAGVILNVASVVGLVPLRLQCAFAAAKAGVVNLTKAMAIELGPYGIRVNALAPGSIRTAGTEKLFYGDGGAFQSRAGELLSSIPLGRPGSVEEVAHAALFLVAPESGYVTGTVLAVDGGWTAGYLRDF